MFGMTSDQTFQLLEDLGGLIAMIAIIWILYHYMTKG